MVSRLLGYSILFIKQNHDEVYNIKLLIGMVTFIGSNTIAVHIFFSFLIISSITNDDNCQL